MPSKIQLDENLWFLFICLQKSDYKTIDFNAVGQATNLKSPAARMRFTRLRRQIEGGTMIGTHGIPFLGAISKISSEVRKHQGYSQSTLGEVKCDTGFVEKTPVNRKIKFEPQEFSEYNEADSSECGDSEDEVPLAKRKHAQVKSRDVALEGLSLNANPEQQSKYHENPYADPLPRLSTAPPREGKNVSHSHYM